MADVSSADAVAAVTQVTALLHALCRDRPSVLPALFASVQDDLHRIAHRERVVVGAGDTLSTTALVNEVYLKLRDAPMPTFVNRGHFFSIAARAMRQVLVDYARAQNADKRGGGQKALAIDEQGIDLHDPVDATGVLEMNDALDRLERVRPRLAQVVYLRFYAGLDDREIGSLLGVEQSTVRRDWLKARGWLYEHLHPGGQPS